jgi:GalNAc-alpha-(1->4)-GalNAc-alpha-(1->3)-diNAcBac-PP-undecaprenol alpha-1,4-N-acetyl-D-galactosaminyltransferase
LHKHICFIIPSVGVGGAERVVSILANYLVSIDYDVTIICLVKNIAYSIDEKINIVFPEFNTYRNIDGLFGVIKYYRKIIKKIKPDVVLSFLEFYNEITMLALLGIKKKIFLFDRNNPFLKEQNIAQSILRKVLYPQADGLVVQTKRAAEYIDKLRLNSNVLILPNPLSEIKEVWKPDLETKKIICVGRIEAQKNHKYLIDVFSEVNNDGWILQFVGDGSCRPELEKYVNTLNIKKQVNFLGIRNDVQSLLAESTIFAFPSLWEGFPNALLEAMAVGVPCISNNCPTGPSEIIQDGVNGFLIDVGDMKEFKRKLMILMSDKELRVSFSASSKVVMFKYTIGNISKILLNIIDL